MTGRWGLALTDDVLDLLTNGIEVDAERLKRLGRDAFTLVDQAKEDVLGADVVVVEHLRLFLGEDDYTAGLIGELLKHKLMVTATTDQK